MADNVSVTSGTGVSVASDQGGGGEQYQWIKMKYGSDGSFVDITTASGFPVQVLSLPPFPIVSISGLTSASVSVSNLSTTLQLVSGTTIAITSLPDLGLNSSVKITSLPAFAPGQSISVSGLTSASVSISNLSTTLQLFSGTTIAITSLPDLGVNSSVKITSLPNFAPGQIISISGLSSAIVSIGAGSVVSVSGLSSASVSISNLSSIVQIVSGTTIAITSLPDLGLNSFVKISSLPGCVLISATNAIPVNVVAGGAGNGSILDGANTAIKATVLSYSNASPLAVRLSDASGDYVTAGGGTQYADGAVRGSATGTLAMGDDGTNIQSLACNTSGHLRVEVMSQPAVTVSIVAITVSNLSTVPLTVSGTTIAIVGIVSVTNHGITSLPALGFGGAVSVSGLTSAAVSISNLATTLQLVSGTTIEIVGIVSVTNHSITSLPALGFGGAVSVSGLTSASVSISNLSTTIQIVSGTTIAITSLPNLGAGSAVKVTSLPALGFGGLVSVSNGAIISLSAGGIVSVTNLVSVMSSPPSYHVVIAQTAPRSGYFRFTSTYAAEATNSVVIALPGSTTAIHLTDVLISNENTAGNVSLWESPSNTTIRLLMDRVYLAANGGFVGNFNTPIVLDTNAALVLTSRTVTNHSVTVVGYII